MFAQEIFLTEHLERTVAGRELQWPNCHHQSLHHRGWLHSWVSRGKLQHWFSTHVRENLRHSFPHFSLSSAVEFYIRGDDQDLVAFPVVV